MPVLPTSKGSHVPLTIKTMRAARHPHVLSVRDLGWTVGIHMVFIVPRVSLALADRTGHI